MMPFIEIVRQYFDPVAKNFRMKHISNSDFEVCYKNEQVSMRINFDCNRSYELDVRISKNTPLSDAFSLAEILRLKNVYNAVSTSLGGTMASEKNKLSICLEKLAVLTSNYAEDFIRGDESAFTKLAQLRNEESKKLERESMLSIVRAKANSAWKEKDYQGVISAYDGAENHLVPSEKKRLEYARKRLVAEEREE